MPRANFSSLILAVFILLLVVLGCKSAAEKERQRQNQEAREQKAAQKKKNSELITNLEASADSWAKLAPKLQLVNDPYIKGKLVVVYRRADDINEIHENDVVGFGELQAQSPEEVQTVVQTDCFQVRRGSYVTQDQEKKEIPAYISECEITLIDLSQPAIIFRKKFENTKLAEEISSTSVDWETIKRKNKVVAPEPQAQIRDFLLSLPRS